MLKSLGVAVAAAVLVGAAYEQVGRWQDRRRYPQVGRSVDIGGRTLNIYCSGEGSPAVIFDSGGHTAGYDWISVQPQVAKFTRACWYDRAGYGWSDPGPLPRTSAAVAKDLHALLEGAKIPPPYVLAGPNIAGIHIRVYNGLYPGDVAGAVLIDSSSLDDDADEPKFMKGPMAFVPSFVKTVGCSVVMPAVLQLGIRRLFSGARPRGLGATDLTPAQQAELEFLSGAPATLAGGEGCGMEESSAQVRASGSFGDRMLIVLTSADPFTAHRPEEAKATAGVNDRWVHTLQARLVALSTRGRQVIVENGNFGIEHEAPDAVIAAVREVVTEVRSAQRK